MIRRFLRTFSRRQGKTPPPTPPARPAGDDWTPGELAECIHAGPWVNGLGLGHKSGPKFGDRHIVAATRRGVFSPLLLQFERFKSRAYDAGGFRKVKRRADGDNTCPDKLIGATAPEDG